MTMQQCTKAQWIEHYLSFGMFDGLSILTNDLKNLRFQERSKVPLSTSQSNQLEAIRSLLDPLFDRKIAHPIPRPPTIGYMEAPVEML